MTRTFRDGHTETWFAAEATLGWWGPDSARHLVAATADPGTPPGKATWYLVTDLPRPGGPREASSPHPAADLAEIKRIYGIRHWTGQSYKQVKDELGCADFQVRSDTAIRRHQVLLLLGRLVRRYPATARSCATAAGTQPRREGATQRLTPAGAVLAAGAARDTRLAHPRDRAATLVAGMVKNAPATTAASPDDLARSRPGPHLYIPS